MWKIISTQNDIYEVSEDACYDFACDKGLRLDMCVKLIDDF